MGTRSDASAPVAEWCSLRQAVQWIAYGMPPRAPEYEDAFRVPAMVDPDFIPEEDRAQSELQVAILIGSIDVFGRKGCGEACFCIRAHRATPFDPGWYVGPFASHEDEAAIPPASIKEAGAKGIDAATDRIWCITHYRFPIAGDPIVAPEGMGHLIAHPVPAVGWGYGEVRMRTADLFRVFPPVKSDDGRPATHGRHGEVNAVDEERAREMYRDRVRGCGGNPPLETTKAGKEGDREWASRVGIPRPLIARLREELGNPASRGRPRKTAGNSAEE